MKREDDGDASVATDLIQDDPSGGRPKPAPTSRTGTWWVFAVVLTLGATLLGVALGGHQRQISHLDVFDEDAHYAYAVALGSGHLPAWGATYTAGERRLIDCLLSPEYSPPAKCGARPAPVGRYPAGGYDYEAQQPPLGYLPFALTANPQAPPHTALAAARRGGIVWVALSGALLLIFAALDGLSLLALAAMLGTCLLDPIFTYATGTVNNDAAGVAAGTVALIAWRLSKRRPHWSIWLGVTAGVLIGLTKALFVVVPFALVIMALVEEHGAVFSSFSGFRAAAKRNLCSLTMLASSLLVSFVWVEVQDARAAVPSSVVEHALLGFSRVATLQPRTIGHNLASLLTLFQPHSPWVFVNVVWSIAVFGVLFGLWFLPVGGPDALRSRGLAAGVLVGIAAIAIGWPLILFLQGHYDGAADVRYAIPFLPLIAYAIVRGCRKFGMAVVGVALPVTFAAVQLGVGRY
jgi:hypothetical protein